MEIHIRTLAFVFLSLLGSVSLPFLVSSVPEGEAAQPSPQALPTPTLVPLRGLSAQSQHMAAHLQQVLPTPAVERTAASTATTTTAIVRTNGANLNIRSGPGLDHAIIGSVPPGTELAISGISTDRQWLQTPLASGNGRGWVNAALTTLDGDPQTLPAIGEE